MNQSPKVTALVPSYNHGSYLRQRIESIMLQSYRNIELIVIDDCSDDDSDAVIKSLQSEYEFRYIRNARNSGTPFAAWGVTASIATGEYIWICESDDFAAPDFLATAVEKMLEHKDAVLFYCNSWIVDTTGTRIDHTDSYFHDIWRELRWDADFCSDGVAELRNFQLRGQTVPNMSSSLIASHAFRQAYHPFLKKLKLTGDWLFIGWVMRYGSVVFSNKPLSHFRKHEVTSRVRVKAARSQAEFVLTKYLLFRETGKPVKDFAQVMSTDAVRFLYEPAGWLDVVKALFQVSVATTLKFGVLLAASVAMNKQYLKRFYDRYKSVKEAG